VPVTVAFLHGFAAGFQYAARLLFQNHAPIDNHVFIGHVELGDAAGNLRAHQLFQLGGVLGAAAAGRHKGAHAHIH
jgi:hypothetical protein